MKKSAEVKAPPSEPPLSYEEINRRIIRRYDELPSGLKIVAGIVSQNPNDVAILTLSQLSSRYGVPSSNFVRLAKALDIDGFSSLQDVFRSRLIDIIPSLTSRLSRFKEEFTSSSEIDETDLSPVEKMVRLDYEVLNRRSSKSLSAEARNLAAMIANARRVFIVGAHRFYSASVFFEYMLTYLGLDARTLTNIGFSASERVKSIGVDDVVVGISFHYYSREVLAILEALAERDVPIFAITDYEFSPLVKLTENQMLLPGLESNFNASISPLMTLLQVTINELGLLLDSDDQNTG